MAIGLKRWQEENERLTKEDCHRLLRRLKEQHLDPIHKRLSGADGASMSFDKITAAYSRFEKDFQRDARGPKDVCAQVFKEFYPVGSSY